MSVVGHGGAGFHRSCLRVFKTDVAAIISLKSRRSNADESVGKWEARGGSGRETRHFLFIGGQTGEELVSCTLKSAARGCGATGRGAGRLA